MSSCNCEVETMAKFCGACGNPVEETMAFCNRCGRPLPKTAPTPVAAPAPVVTPVQPAPPPPVQPVYAPPVQSAPPAPAAIPIKETAGPVSASSTKKTAKKPTAKDKLIAFVAAMCVVVLMITVSVLNTDPKIPQRDNGIGGSYNGGTNIDVNGGVNNGGSGNGGNNGGNNTGGSAIQNQPVQNIKRTVMIYLVGSDLETKHQSATKDIEEMIAADIDPAKTQVLICTGGSKQWHYAGVSADENAVFLLEQNAITKVKSSTKKNMADGNTLADFIRFSIGNYPADRYSLILWDHGGGPICGYGQDEQYNDVMSVAELRTALSSSLNGKLEMLGFDACLMGSAECAWAFRDLAEYYVASEEVEPGFGWNFAFLEDLPRCADGGDMGQLIVDTYFDFYNDLFQKRPLYRTDITLSCTDLSKIGAVEIGINNLFEDVNAEILSGKISEASRCRYRSKAFGKEGGNFEYDLIDLGHITDLLAADYPAEAQALKAVLKSYVVYSRTNTANAGGVSIYHPYDNRQLVSSFIRTFESFGFADNYAKYIRNFESHVLAQGGGNGAYRDLGATKGTAVSKNQKSDLSIPLTEEQAATFAGAEYYVFYALPADVTFSGNVEYLQVFSGQDCTLNGGTLSATYEDKAVFGKADGKYSPFPLSMYQIYDGSGNEKYYFSCIFHKTEELDMEPADWLMRIVDGKPQLGSAYATTTVKDHMLADKMMLNSADYGLYSFMNNSYTVQNGDYGAQFTFTGSSYGMEYYKDQFELELRPIEDKENYYAAFAITDIYGNRYFSDFIPLGE